MSTARLKRYSATTGYVYEYFYAGRREEEYLFQVSADRKNYEDVSVALAGQTERLNDTERYAVVKMSLFRAFDAAETPAALARTVRVGQEQMDEIVKELGLL